RQADLIKTTVHSARSISPTQVLQLIKLLSFGDSQIAVVKTCYNYTNNRGSYASVVGTAITHRSAKAELNECIRQQNKMFKPPEDKCGDAFKVVPYGIACGNGYYCSIEWTGNVSWKDK
ncbi:unnamed protein product, partial [Rotaria magnacalcarata]